jgi:hypothetical protein
VKLQEDQAVVTRLTLKLKKKRRGGGRFSKCEMDEKFESSEEMVEDREEVGLSKKITRTED